jgi:tRNA A-37 threonylcarbamoyl transferase component Bud32
VLVTEPPPGRPFAKYQLLDVVAQGGMGVVYKAHDTVLGRTVALKMIRSGALAHPEEIARFTREAQAASRLDHPNIIAVYEVGEHQQHHFFTMAFAAGGSLAGQRERLTQAPREAVALVEKVARGVHYAHSRGILHRDLKPGNILLDERGEPKVSDFGLAKLLDASVELTQSGQRMGTPAYMAPEQAAGQASRVGPPCDVWALGVILYELLTGSRPFAAGERDELTRQILTSDPLSPRQLRPELDDALQTVVLKCLEKEPDRRYATAADLADDLRRWLAGEPITARREAWPRRAWRWARRRVRAGVVLAALGAVALGAWFLSDREPPVQPVPGPPAAEKPPDVPPPELQLRRLQRELAAGKPVDVLDDKGQLRWSRWLVAEAGTMPPQAGDKHLILHTYTDSYLEVLPDPQHTRYRFEAEVRHEAGDSSVVGIFLCPKKLDQKYWFVQLEFADRGSFSKTEKGPGGAPAARAALLLRPQREARLGPPWSIHNAMRAVLFTPGPPPARSPWRRLALVVSPEGIQAEWEGQPFPVLTRAELEGVALRMVNGRPQLDGLDFTFDPRGSLGLFALKGMASFRKIRVTPLASGR